MFPWYLWFSWRDLWSFPFDGFSLFLCIDHWGRLSYLSLLFFGTLHSNGYISPFLLCLLFLCALWKPFPPETHWVPEDISISYQYISRGWGRHSPNSNCLQNHFCHSAQPPSYPEVLTSHDKPPLPPHTEEGDLSPTPAAWHHCEVRLQKHPSTALFRGQGAKFSRATLLPAPFQDYFPFFLDFVPSTSWVSVTSANLRLWKYRESTVWHGGTRGSKPDSLWMYQFPLLFLEEIWQFRNIVLSVVVLN